MRIRFWSSVEGTAFMQGLIRELTEVGLSAEQCYQISEASYRSARSTPARLFLRFRQYVAYPIQLGVALLARRVLSFKLLGFRGNRSDEHLASDSCPLSSECIVVCTNTFYAPLIATYLHPNVVHLVYDLFPEAMIHSGKWTEGTLKVKIVRWITKQTLKRAKTNVFLGERLKDYVESIHGAVENAAIIAVGADQALFGRSPALRGQKPEVREQRSEDRGRGGDASNHTGPKILYCGNFGNMHESATLFQYWKQVAEVGGQKSEARGKAKRDSAKMVNRNDLPEAKRRVTEAGALRPAEGASQIPDNSASSSESFLLSNFSTFHFFCSGPKRAELEAVLSELPADLKKQIQLGGGLDQQAWIATMESADVALVTMVPGSETVVMPSKTYSAMMAGQAILAIAPEDSDLVDLIKAADCGWFVEPGDVAGLAAVIDAICADPAGLLEKRERAYQYAHAHLGQDALAQEWKAVLIE
jgi:hypothetical protein